MQYVITDWMSNICFDSDLKPFDTFEDGWDFIYTTLAEELGEDYDEEELGEYYVVEYTDNHRIDYVGSRKVLRQLI